MLFIFWDFIGKAIQVYDFHIFLKVRFFKYYLPHFFRTTNAFCFKSYFVWCKYYNISFLPASIFMVYLYPSLLHSFYVTLSVCPRILKISIWWSLPLHQWIYSIYLYQNSWCIWRYFYHFILYFLFAIFKIVSLYSFHSFCCIDLVFYIPSFPFLLVKKL